MATALCPRCRGQLFIHDHAAVDFVLCDCGVCSGVWLDNRGCHLLVSGALPESVRDTLRTLAADEEVAGGHVPPARGYREPALAGDAGLACPVCSAALHPYVTDEDRQGVRVHLDVCAAHGTWFDRGEAWTLFQAVELKKLALHVDLETDALEHRWKTRERAWAGFVAGAIRGPLRR